MSNPRKGPVRFAWRSTCATCKAFFHWCYSAFVLLLVAVTIFAAYVATLDDIPVPDFLIRELQLKLKSEGLALRMEGVRFQPNGRITFIEPELIAPEFGSAIFAADRAVAKVKLTHLLFGSVAVNEVRLSAGRFILPAMLTPTGEPITAIQSLNLEATHRGQRWYIDYANGAIDELKLSVDGVLDSTLLKIPPPQADTPKFSATRAILNIAPKISRLRDELKRFDSPFAKVTLNVISKRQTARLEAGARSLRVTPDIQARDLLLLADLDESEALSLYAESSSVTLPQESSVSSLRLATDWDALPNKLQPYPNRIQFSVTSASHRGTAIPSLVATASPHNTYHKAELQLALPSSPINVVARHQIASKETEIDLQAMVDSDTIGLLAPLAKELAQLDISEMVSIGSGVDAQASLTLNSDLQPISASAYGTSGSVNILGASIDHSATHATLKGKQIDVTEIRLHSGKQSGVIKIGYNLDTLLRRILVEGSFDPTMINGWFKPWWSAMWDGMVFPDEGMLTYLDSQATFKRPDTVFVTGLGLVRDFDLRGLDVAEFRTRLFSRFHYVDLYDMQLDASDDQQAQGEIQFWLDRDLRDEKDKLTGIWIQAISTLDVKRAPELLWEISDAAAEILVPYCYHLPPLIEARSSSVRYLDEYQNDIDLQIETDAPFSYYGFPFDSLETFVHVDDDTVDIPYATGRLGGGIVDTSIFVVGDIIELDLNLAQSGFGETLNAANTYFAKDGSETAQQMDTEKLLNYGGQLDARFSGSGIAGDATSFTGEGEFAISNADFGKFQLFGLLSMALEITPLRFTTLKFNKASGSFTVDHELVHFADNKVEGPVATIEANGNYNIETDALYFAAKLFPFRNSKVPIISPIINLPLNIISNVFEVSVTGTFSEPQLRLFNPSTEEQINVAPNRNTRDSRPSPRSR